MSELRSVMAEEEIVGAYRALLAQVMAQLHPTARSTMRAQIYCTSASAPAGPGKKTVKDEKQGQVEKTLTGHEILARDIAALLTAEQDVAGQSGACLVQVVAGAEGAPVVVLPPDQSALRCEPGAQPEKDPKETVDGGSFSDISKILVSRSYDLGTSLSFVVLLPELSQAAKGIGIDYVTNVTGLVSLENSSEKVRSRMYYATELSQATQYAQSQAGQGDQYSPRLRYLLAALAVKEAVFKAVGEAFALCCRQKQIPVRAGFMDIEVRDALGVNPQIITHRNLTHLVEELEISRFVSGAFLLAGYAGALCFAL